MLGKQLKKAREAAGKSRERLAFEAGVHRTYISLLEQDKKSSTLNVLLRICRALNVSAADEAALVGIMEQFGPWTTLGGVQDTKG
jgi:transcriptional regulator with XRE-family HTH domain